MRNLQKILALALALIMSFSLVVTANAAFSDEADITDTYNEAVNVLSQLEVFKGYTDGTYQPQKSITRAEVAAIIYRIATGDVADTQVSIYSDWNRFTDVHAGEWWAGYINYCANAEYIKGYGNGKFGPDDPVTGYEALAMILRAVGYGKMDGEFQGSDWAVQTAARANTLKVTKNVQNSALLNSAATRELVAELLFRSILVPTVEYNQFSGYTENDTTLAYQSFGLERIEGVVVANEYANLYDTEVLAKDKTDLQEADGTIRHLDITSELTDMGEARYAYIIDGVRGAKVLGLEDTGSNKVFDNTEGKKQNISTAKKFKDVSGIDLVEGEDGTEFYVNFGREGYYTCDYRLEFSVSFYSAAAEESFDDDYIDISVLAAEDDEWTVTGSYSAEGGLTYKKIIRAEKQITDDDLKVIKGIFAAADDLENNDEAIHKITGDVFVGTKSNPDLDQKERDISNEISYRTFFNEYINAEAWDRNFEESANGEWLKIVDNNNDGKAEYAFLTEYFLDEVVRVTTKDNETKLEYRYLDVDEDTARYVTTEELKLGTVVLYTLIDGQALIDLPEIATDEIKAISFKDETVTTDGDVTYGQSGINNETKMDEIITNMDEDVAYNMYLDRYGFIRAYAPVEGDKYGLLTELYYGYQKNGRYVTSKDLTAELTAGGSKTEEFAVLNENGNDFVMKNVANSAGDSWGDLTVAKDYDKDYVIFNSSNHADQPIVLQPATAHLSLYNSLRTFEDGKELFDPAVTNVARYVKGENGIRITSAAEFAENTKGEQLYYTSTDETVKQSRADWVAEKVKDGVYATKTAAESAFDSNVRDNTFKPVYAVDYVQLEDVGDIAADQWRWYEKDSTTKYVSAVHDTEFYVVTRNAENGRIAYFTDYENVNAISDEGDNIRAVYAVAENTTATDAKKDYWVANVIVIEVGSYVGDYDSISMAFRNPNQNSGTVKSLDTLNNQSSDPELTIVPDDFSWDREWEDYGFYKVYNTEMQDDGRLLAETIEKIEYVAGKKNYNDNHIFAGYVEELEKVNSRGGYIVARVIGATANTPGAKTEKVSIDGVKVYGIDDKTAKLLDLDDETNRSDVKTGDRIIWVENAKKNEVFIVVLDDNSTRKDWDTPSWLFSEWDDIMTEQAYVAPGGDEETVLELTEMTVKGVKVIADGEVLEDVSLSHTQATETSTLVDWSLKTNADVEVVTVIMNGTPESKTVASETAATTNKSDLTSGGATSVKFSVILTKGNDSKTVNIEVPIAAASKDATVKKVLVKGVEAELDTSDTTGKTYTVHLTSTQAADTTEFILAVTPNHGDASVDYVSSGTTAGTITADALTEKGALTTAGAIKFKVTPETSSAGDAVEYTINVTIGTGSTGPTIQAKAGKSTLNGDVLTVPAGVNLEDGWEAYFEVASGVKDTSEVEITGKTITVTNTEPNKEPAIKTYTWVNEVITIAPTFKTAQPTGVTSAGVKKIVLDQTKVDPIKIEDANGIITGWTKTPSTGTLVTLAANAEVSYTIDGTEVTTLNPLTDDGKTLVVDAVWKTDDGAVAAELSLSIQISVE